MFHLPLMRRFFDMISTQGDNGINLLIMFILMQLYHHKARWLALVIGLTVATSVSAAENGFHPHESIRNAVKDYLVVQAQALNFNDIHVETGQIDPRLNLARCPAPLHTELAGSDKPVGNVTVEVKCTVQNPWKIYLQASIKAYTDVVTAKINLNRNSILMDQDIELKKQDVSQARSGYYLDKKQVAGKTLKRSLHAGEIIEPRMLIKSRLVKRGQIITLIAETNGITVRMSGKAMNDAAKGEPVRVKNTSSNRIVEGVAVANGIVKVIM